MRQSGAEEFLICYPPDETFEKGVRTVIDDLGGLRLGSVEAVELKLHERFPDLQIVVHESLAGDTTHATTWVVFRDRPERMGAGRQRRTRRNDRRPSTERHAMMASRRTRQARQPVALVVDDEGLVLMLMSMVLTARGWRVIQASNGEDALARAEGAELDLLVTDAEMPGMDGRTLARRLCERHSDLPVLVVSGRPEASDWTERVRHSFLAKPFGIEALAARVESLTGYATAWTSSNRSGGA